MTSGGFDHESWIANCVSYIKNVHLKDRTKNPITTVKPFTGDTDFDLIFDKLALLGYKGRFTLQTAREEEGQELLTTIKNGNRFKQLYDEKFI
jgi:sugar phosphate isomerase/epimerase